MESDQQDPEEYSYIFLGTITQPRFWWLATSRKWPYMGEKGEATRSRIEDEVGHSQRDQTGQGPAVSRLGIGEILNPRVGQLTHEFPDGLHNLSGNQ